MTRRYTVTFLAIAILAVLIVGISFTGSPASAQEENAAKPAAAPLGDAVAMQVWRCELKDDATEEMVLEAAEEWLAAAKKVKGGENLQMYVKFPVVVNATGEIDLLLIILAPTFKEWGRFWDGYRDSEAAELEGRHVVAPDSTMWESFKVYAEGETAPEKEVGPPFGRGKAVQWWRCELVGAATEEQVMAKAREWLTAARKVKGGKNLQLRVNFPVVVNATGRVDLILMLAAPHLRGMGGVLG